jgi:hypothetical protein
LHDFWYKVKKNQKKYAKERELSGLKDMAVWKDFRPSYILEVVWAKHIQHVTPTRFT